MLESPDLRRAGAIVRYTPGPSVPTGARPTRAEASGLPSEVPSVSSPIQQGAGPAHAG
jgi:hypothetical protein